MPRKVAALFTGGKDSTRALEIALKQGLKVEYLVTMVPRREESWMYHSVGLNVVELLSDAIGIPLVKAETEGVKEEEVEDLKRALEALKIEGVVCGAIASKYQRDRVARVCSELGLDLYTPLWGVDEERYLEELLRDGYEIMVVSVSALGLNEKWLGRVLDHEALEELKKLKAKLGINLSLEGGEAETLVLDSPIHRKRLVIVEAEKIWDGRSGVLRIKKAELRDKP
ncbi:MAG: TIGR00289 family protein [Thermoprotei archaeon]|nr:MAG: TIGR00289 family protein [Thermoprotei archaeon]